MWLVERHRLLCVSADDLGAMDRLLDGERLVFVACEPALCDRIAGHFRQLTGRDATLAETGQSFATVAAQREKESAAQRRQESTAQRGKELGQ